MHLKKYWITIGDNYTLSNCYGVTAWTEADAMNILKENADIKNSNSLIKEIKSLEELEKNHVLPNIGDPVIRGIWYPQGLSSARKTGL